mgnify:CR=1 FL=1
MYLVTGCAGFIGMSVVYQLLKKNKKVIGVDNMNKFYNEGFKKKRLLILKKNKNFKFFNVDISNKKKIQNIFKKNKPKVVIHLAAQAGVRNSIQFPDLYLKSNLVGFFNILESVRLIKPKIFLFASSSSVYGYSKGKSFKESDNTDKCLSFYGATKKSNEIMAHSYFHQFNLSIIGLRFFTVYGPWNRPDMAAYTFAKNIKNSKKINVFAKGNLRRDFTFINDVVASIDKLIIKSLKKNKPFFKIFNIGNNNPIQVKRFIQIMEKNLDKKSKKIFKKRPKTDLVFTNSNSNKLIKFIRYKPYTNINSGLKLFFNWFNKI